MATTEEKVRLTAQRYGLDPDWVARVAGQESGFSQAKVSPKGARGVMQLMPGTARDLGVNASDEDQNIDGGVRYLKQQYDRFGGDVQLASAAYNAGPEAVARHGGVPPYRETQNYVRTVTGGGDVGLPSAAELLGGGASANPSPNATGGGGLPSAQDLLGGPAAAPAPRPVPNAPIAPRPNVAADAVTGLASGGEKGVMGLLDQVLQGPVGSPLGILQNAAGMASLLTGHGPGKLPGPVSPATAIASRNGYTPETKTGRFAETVGTMLPNAIMPGSAGARVANVALPAIGNEGGQQVADALGLGEAGHQVAGLIGSVLGGGAASVRAAPKAAALPTADLEALKTANTEAWKKVDASTAQFASADAKAMASDIRNLVNEADPALYPKADLWAKKIQGMVARGDLTLGKLNLLKSRMGNQLNIPGSVEADLGQQMSARIEALINTSKDPSLASARDLYKRLSKAQEVTKRTDSADLRAASTYAGGNQANATRQNLRPLIDPKSSQRINNLTPDEKAALNKVVRGTGGANAWRTTGKLLDPRGLLGATVQSVFGLPSHGLSTASIPLGFFASDRSNKATAKAVDDLLNLIVAGGVRPKAAPAPSRAYAGLPAVTAPILVATPAAASQQKRRQTSPR